MQSETNPQVLHFAHDVTSALFSSKLMRLLALFCIVLGVPWTVRAQIPTPNVNAASVSGTVIKEPGSEPLKKVLVQVIAEDQKQGGNYTASSDTDGHFRIENVQPGRYRIFVERTGFVPVNARGVRADTNVIAVQPGQTEEILFRMLPTAVISGRITDEDGDPMSEVRVMVQKKRPGKLSREGAGMGTTNDLGEFRIAGLFPGQYWVAAVPPPDARDYEPSRKKASVDDRSGEDHSADSRVQEAQPDTRYITTYYPGTFDAMQAASVNLKAGDELPVNLTLVPGRTFSVRGVVTGVPPGQKAAVVLVSRGGEAFHGSEVGPDGQFEIRGVGPGSYSLMATTGESQSPRIHQDVTVVAADIEGLRLAPAASFRLSGHLRVEGAVSRDAQLTVNLRPTEQPDDAGFFMSPDYFGANAVADRNGNFEWKDVTPGNYIVQVYATDGQGLFLKSVTLGGRDVETGFAASAPASLDVLMSDKGATIEGVVVGQQKDKDKDEMVGNAAVVAVPEEKYRKLPDHFVVGSTDQNGRFILRGLPPGSYTLYAWQDVEEGVYHDPDFLKSQEANGTGVKAAEGSSQRIELKLSDAGADWR